MACENCKPYIGRGTFAGNLGSLEKAFDIKETDDFGLACMGDGVCRTCKTEIVFTFEEFIHAKLSVQVTKNVDLGNN